MAITLDGTVDTTSSTGSAGTIASNGRNQSAGKLLVAAINWQNTTISGIADTAGNTWQHVPGAGSTDGANNHQDLWYCYNCLGNAANVVTVTFNASNSFRGIAILSFNGTWGTGDPFDAAAPGASGSGLTADSGNVALTGASDVIVACAIMLDQSFAPGTGYTGAQEAVTYFGYEYHVVSAAEHATATQTNSTGWGITAAAFKETGGSPGNVTLGSIALTTALPSVSATTPPGPPTIGTASAINTWAEVYFTAGLTGSSATTSYTATASPGGQTGTYSGAGNGRILVSGLTTGTAYTFTVHATNAVGNSAESSASNSVTPQMATGFGGSYIGTADATSDSGFFVKDQTGVDASALRDIWQFRSQWQPAGTDYGHRDPNPPITFNTPTISANVTLGTVTLTAALQSPVASGAASVTTGTVALTTTLPSVAPTGYNTLFRRVAFFGDSIAAGYGSSDAAHEWTNLLRRTNLGTSQSLFGYSGNSTSNLIGNGYAARVVAQNPDLVIFECPLDNDANNSIPTATTMSNMDTLMSTLTAGLPSARILVTTPPPEYPSATLQQTYVTALTSHAASQGWEYYDIATSAYATAVGTLGGSVGSTILDGVHPNDLGQQAIANLYATYFSATPVPYSLADPAYVTDGEAGSGSTGQGAFNVLIQGGGVPAGGTVVVAVISRDDTTGDKVTISDAKVNTYHEAKGQTGVPGGNQFLSIWYAYNITALVGGAGGDTITITPNTGTNRGMAMIAFMLPAAGTADPFDVAVSAEGTASVPESGTTATTAQVNELIFSVVAGLESGSSVQDWTPPNRWRAVGGRSDSLSSLTAAQWLFIGSRLVTATGTYDGTGGTSALAQTPANWQAATVAFKTGIPAAVTLGTVGLTTALPSVVATGGSGGSPGNVTLGTVALTTNLPAPAATGAGSVTTGTVALTTALPAPTVTGGGSVTTGTVALTAAQPATVPTGGANVTLSIVALTTALPAVAATAAATITLSSVALSLALPAVTPGVAVNATTGSVGLTLALPAPTATGGGSVTTGTVALTKALPAVVPSGAASVTTGVVALTLATPAVTPSSGGSVTTGSIGLTLALPAAAATAAAATTLGTVALTAALPSTSPSGGGSVTTGSIALTLGLPSVAAGVSASVTTGSVSVTLALPSVIATGAASVATGSIGLTLALPNVIASAGGSGNVTLSAVALTVALPAPSATGGGSTTTGTVGLSVALQSVSPSGGGSVTTGTVALTVAVPAISASGGVTATLSSIALTVALPAPTGSGGASVTTGAVALVAAPQSVTASSAAAGSVTLSSVGLTLALPVPTVAAGATMTLGTVALTAGVQTVVGTGAAITALGSVGLTLAVQSAAAGGAATAALAPISLLAGVASVTSTGSAVVALTTLPLVVTLLPVVSQSTVPVLILPLSVQVALDNTTSSLVADANRTAVLLTHDGKGQ